MKKLWALLFLSVPVWGVGLFVVAATAKRDTWWWPDPLSSYGQAMDQYFWAIAAVTGVTFVATTGLLGYFMLKYTDERPGRASHMSHSTALEASWTIGTIIILIFVSAPQIDDWEHIKVLKYMPEEAQKTVFAEVTGRQFEWRIRYPGRDGALHTIDDVWAPPSELHFYQGHPIRISLRSDDVLHSFFLPDLRIKQDAVPGSTIPVWFDANQAGTFDLVCAELCGWGHYKMRGKIVIHETKAEFDDWLERQRTEQEEASE